MARKYRRDARGRFAGGGYSGQSGGRGARLKAGGAKRAGGGAKMSAARIGGTISKSGKGKSGPRMKAAGLNKDGMAVFKSTDKPAKSYKIPQRQAPAAKPVKATAKGARIGGQSSVMRKSRSQIPATTLNYKQALPVSSANRPRLERARNVKQNALAAVPFQEMQKLRARASVARNPNSVLTKAERSKALSALVKAELQNRKKDRSYKTASRAEDIYTNVAGYTQSEGRRKWMRAGQRGTVFGAGTLRGGPRRSLSGRSSTASVPRPSARRRQSRMWYER